MPYIIWGGGYLPFGYLGVDIFYVISGYFLVKGLLRQYEQKQFYYWKFILHKVIRLWPLVLLAAIAALLIGCFLMLPDDYENLAESAFASSLFANNVLQAITTKNYWNIVNLYKPLMHMWYIGVLMQAYVVLPVIYMICVKLFKGIRRGILMGTSLMMCISLLLYLLPCFTVAWKFYYLPFRIFEIMAGGIVVFVSDLKITDRMKRCLAVASSLTILLILCSRGELGTQSLMLLSVVSATVIFLLSTLDMEISENVRKMVYFGAVIGRRSYSIYIWHQLVIAFLFYSVFAELTILGFCIFVVITFGLSVLTFEFIEKPLGRVIKDRRKIFFVILGGSFIGMAVCIFSFGIYRQAGVVRDVPELNISKKEVHRNMHAEYCDRPYKWDNEFENDNRTKILVIGNSFGRDWANILNEYDQNLDISYIFYSQGCLKENKKRTDDADFVFYALGPKVSDEIPKEVLAAVPEYKLYIIGNKKYGQSNGIIYSKRNSVDYYTQSVPLAEGLFEENEKYKELYGEHYIDMLTPVLAPNNEIYVFTDDQKFISQDCSHLTQAGACYYSKILDIEGIIKGK
ncbi:O-acetyltransferase OatA [Lachnospiraceae bacterium]|nr:O-acetyltransferase OatA [Lachnospiraceae bacterium]